MCGHFILGKTANLAYFFFSWFVTPSLLLFLSNFLVFLRLFFLPCFINYRHCQFLFLFLIFQFLIFFVLMSLNSPATSSFLISSFLISSISDFFTSLVAYGVYRRLLNFWEVRVSFSIQTHVYQRLSRHHETSGNVCAFAKRQCREDSQFLLC